MILAKSIIAGFSMCVLIGPISIIIIRKAIRHNKYDALIPGLGSVTADIFYSSIVGFGITFIANFFTQYEKYFQLIAGFVLCFLAIHILRKPAQSLFKSQNGKLPFIKSFSLGFFLALFNPGTLFLMLTILTALNVSATRSLATSFSIIIGLFIGELSWWIFLVNITELAKGKFGKKAPLTINTFSGIFLLCMSIIIIIKNIFF